MDKKCYICKKTDNLVYYAIESRHYCRDCNGNLIKAGKGHHRGKLRPIGDTRNGECISLVGLKCDGIDEKRDCSCNIYMDGYLGDIYDLLVKGVKSI